MPNKIISVSLPEYERYETFNGQNEDGGFINHKYYSQGKLAMETFVYYKTYTNDTTMLRKPYKFLVKQYDENDKLVLNSDEI